MTRTVILLFDPRLRCQIERIDAEVGFAFKQRHQAAFDAAPERLLLGILIRRIRQRGLMQYAQFGKAGGRLTGQHGRAVIGHQGTW